jgi:cell division protein FtsW
MALPKRRPPAVPNRPQAPSRRSGAPAATRRHTSEPDGRGLLGATLPRKVRPVHAFRPLRGPSRAVMATRNALEPALPAASIAFKPSSETAERALVGASPEIDLLLLSSVVCLVVLGTVFIYSASMYQSYWSNADVNFYIVRQIAWVALGALALAIGLVFDYRQLRRFSMLGLGFTALLLLLVHVPHFSYSANGAARWVKFGPLTLQPSEIGKLALTVYAAHWLSSKDDEIKHSLKGLVPFGAVLGFTTLMIFRQPDLGTAAIVSLAMLGMFFSSGARLRHLLMIGAMALPVGYYVTHHGGYWQARIDAWQHPFANTQGAAYQISRSLLAFWHGGWTGVGLGNGQLKESIPAPMTDTIFATIGEETGLLGASVVVLLFAFFAYRGIRTSILVEDAFGKLLAVGITVYLVVQALLNMLSVTNIIPFTGVPLPFISFGGSSLVVNLLAVGILLNISRHVEPALEEHRDPKGSYLWWRNRRPHLSVPDRGAHSRFRSREHGRGDQRR